jgi:hydrogenase maturation protease
MSKSELSPDKILIHAVGNETRRDDGLALEAIKYIKNKFPDFSFKTDYQLYLEDVLEWCNYSKVWFIDASFGNDLKNRTTQNVPLDFNPSVHHMGPDLLASMAKEIYGSSVEVIVSELPGEDFSLGEGLSSKAKSTLNDFIVSLETQFPIELE